MTDFILDQMHHQEPRLILESYTEDYYAKLNQSFELVNLIFH